MTNKSVISSNAVTPPTALQRVTVDPGKGLQFTDLAHFVHAQDKRARKRENMRIKRGRRREPERRRIGIKGRGILGMRFAS